jgi:hypothetical protein
MADRTIHTPAGASPDSLEIGQIAQALVRSFADRQDVVAIFLNRERGWLAATVITNHDRYDREALTGLLEREYDLRRQFRHADLEVHYLPRLDRDLQEIVPHTAHQVFER